MGKLNTLKVQLASMSTKCALHCIRQKGASAKCFFWNGQMWTPAQALSTWDKYLLEMHCESFGIVRFFGGPPGRGAWYDGTILSILCDLILFDENTQGWAAEEKLSA